MTDIPNEPLQVTNLLHQLTQERPQGVDHRLWEYCLEHMSIEAEKVSRRTPHAHRDPEAVAHDAVLSFFLLARSGNLAQTPADRSRLLSDLRRRVWKHDKRRQRDFYRNSDGVYDDQAMSTAREQDDVRFDQKKEALRLLLLNRDKMRQVEFQATLYVLLGASKEEIAQQLKRSTRQIARDLQQARIVLKREHEKDQE